MPIRIDVLEHDCVTYPAFHGVVGEGSVSIFFPPAAVAHRHDDRTYRHRSPPEDDANDRARVGDGPNSRLVKKPDALNSAPPMSGAGAENRGRRVVGTKNDFVP